MTSWTCRLPYYSIVSANQPVYADCWLDKWRLLVNNAEWQYPWFVFKCGGFEYQRLLLKDFPMINPDLDQKSLNNQFKKLLILNASYSEITVVFLSNLIIFRIVKRTDRRS